MRFRLKFLRFWRNFFLTMCYNAMEKFFFIFIEIKTYYWTIKKNITSNDNDNEQHNITQVAVSQISDETFRVSPKALMPPPPPLILPQAAESLGNEMLWKQYIENLRK